MIVYWMTFSVILPFPQGFILAVLQTMNLTEADQILFIKLQRLLQFTVIHTSQQHCQMSLMECTTRPEAQAP